MSASVSSRVWETLLTVRILPSTRPKFCRLAHSEPALHPQYQCDPQVVLGTQNPRWAPLRPRVFYLFSTPSARRRRPAAATWRALPQFSFALDLPCADCTFPPVTSYSSRIN